MANELGALLEAAGDAADRLAITPAESLHRAIAGRVFRAVGPLSLPTRLIHDAISSAVYGGLRGSVRAASRGAAAVAGAAAPGLRPLSSSRRGRAAISALNGLSGDLLRERGSELAIPMWLSPAPRKARRVAVFVHGLGENEESWRLPPDLGVTPLYVRYNSGLHVSENGGELARLLERLAGMQEIALIGHSMGGLVARSACHQAAEAGLAWPAKVRHLVTLGTPHTGAPLEKGVHALSWALGLVPEARPFGAILDQRSAGIRDLRRGEVLEGASGPDVALLPGCTHTFITATVTRDPGHPLGWAVGDLLVRTESAGGRHRTRAIPLPPESVVHLGPLTHFDLLRHPLVHERLRSLLAA